MEIEVNDKVEEEGNSETGGVSILSQGQTNLASADLLNLGKY